MKRYHYAYLICFASVLTFFCVTGLGCNAFSLYLPYVLKSYGISNTQSSTILMVRSISGFAATAISGWYYRSFSLRVGMLIAGLCSCLGFIVYGLSSGYLMILTGSALTGIGFGLGATLPVSMMLNRWFRRNRNIAMSVAAMGSTLALIGVPSLITWSIGHLGLKVSFLAEAAVIGGIVLICFLIFRSSPSELGLEPYGAGTARSDDITRKGPSASERASSVRYIEKSDWVWLVPAFLALGAIANPAYNHLSVFYSSRGFRPEAIAIAFTIGSVCASAGKFCFGWFSDRFSAFHASLIYGISMIGGLVLLCLIRSNAGLYLGAAAFNLGICTAMTGPMAWAGDLSRPEDFDTTIQRFQKLYTFGSLAFTMLPGMLADRFGGSYTPAYWLFVLFAVYQVATIQRQYIKAGIR